ncbi:MAG: FitA-like ribbon-helix-helix domain-containing protein [Pseudomarimonas sp.]
MTIRNLDNKVKAQLRVRAAQHGRSMEEEVRSILGTALADPPEPEESLYEAIRSRVAIFGGVELELPPREPLREPPDFSGPEFHRPEFDDE